MRHVREESPLDSIGENPELHVRALGEVIRQLLVISTNFRLASFASTKKRGRPLNECPIDGFHRTVLAEVGTILGDAFPRVGEIIPEQREQRADQTLLGGLLVASHVFGELADSLYIVIDLVLHRMVSLFECANRGTVLGDDKPSCSAWQTDLFSRPRAADRDIRRPSAPLGPSRHVTIKQARPDHPAEAGRMQVPFLLDSTVKRSPDGCRSRVVDDTMARVYQSNSAADSRDSARARDRRRASFRAQSRPIRLKRLDRCPAIAPSRPAALTTGSRRPTARTSPCVVTKNIFGENALRSRTVIGVKWSSNTSLWPPQATQHRRPDHVRQPVPSPHRRHPARRTKRRLTFEPLEGRQLMSIGPQFIVDTPEYTYKNAVATASSTNGCSVAVWVEYATIDGGQGLGVSDIQAQYFNAAGNKSGPEIYVAIKAGVSEDQPAVAMDAKGDFVVAWREHEPNGNTDVLAQVFNSSSVAITGVIPVGVGTFYQHEPSVAMEANGNFVVAYTRDTNDNNPDVFAKAYSANGQLRSRDHRGRDALAESNPSIAMDPAGAFDIAYQVQNGTTTTSTSPGIRRRTACSGWCKSPPVPSRMICRRSRWTRG